MNKLESTIKDNLPKLIDYFVRVYGEEYRKQISNRLNNTIFLFASDDKESALNMLDDKAIILGRAAFEDVDFSIMDGANFTTASFDDLAQPINICSLNDNDCWDSAIMHELGHAIESNIYPLGDRFVTRTGLVRREFNVDFASRSYGEDLEQDDKMFFINEVINDYLTRKVCALMVEEDFKLIQRKNEDFFYSEAFPLVGEFIEDNLEIIIKSRMEGKPNDFINLFGKENFDKFVAALDDYFYFQIRYDDKIDNDLKENNLSISDLVIEENVPSSLKVASDYCKKVKGILDGIKSRELEPVM